MISRADILSARVPRYTSYPTAPHFHAGVDAATYRAWLEDLPRSTDVSLYVHIPFCDSLCWFCGCHTKIVNNYNPISAYHDTLMEEIALVAPAVGAHHRVTHMHWGGGSPTLLRPEDIARLADALREHFTFAETLEFAVEIDPRGLTDETIASLAQAGLTRASIGVQDCNERVQRAVNRLQPFTVTQSAVERLRAAGVDAVNLDVMYGLPYQTVADVESTIDRTLVLGANRYAVFGYAHVPEFKRHQRLIPVEALPGLDERLAEANAAHARLVNNGYVPIGLDHYAKSDDALALAQCAGTLKRNFQGYTTDTAPALIGLGASAISALPQGYAQNAPDVRAWRQALASRNLATARGIALTPEDVVRRAIIERLMCDLEVDTDFVARECGFPAGSFTFELSALLPYAEAGLVDISGTRVRVPADARAFVRIVSSLFDSRLRMNNARHAAAV